MKMFKLSPRLEDEVVEGGSIKNSWGVSLDILERTGEGYIV